MTYKQYMIELDKHNTSKVDRTYICDICGKTYIVDYENDRDRMSVCDKCRNEWDVASLMRIDIEHEKGYAEYIRSIEAAYPYESKACE